MYLDQKSNEKLLLLLIIYLEIKLHSHSQQSISWWGLIFQQEYLMSANECLIIQWMFATPAKYIQGCVPFWFSIDAKLDKIQPLFLQKVIANLSKATSIISQHISRKKKINSFEIKLSGWEKKSIFIHYL